MNLHFSPKELVKTCKQKFGLIPLEKAKVTRGMIAPLRECMTLANISEEFTKNLYYPVMIEFLELLSQKLYADFQEKRITAEAFFKGGEILKEIAEHPFKLIEQGRKAQATLQEWDEQGQTQEVADADAALAQGGQ